MIGTTLFCVFLILPVMGQKILQPVAGFLQYRNFGQIHNPKMVRFFPMEAAAVGDQNVLFLQESSTSRSSSTSPNFLRSSFGKM